MIKYDEVIVSIYSFNWEGTKILVGKQVDQNSWNVIGGKLEYGEEFDDCAKRVIKSATNIYIEDPIRLKFICTYNAVDKINKNHIVAVDYYVQFTKEEETNYFKLDIFYFKKWGWYNFEELVKMQDNLFCSIQIFLIKFNIQNFDDIRNLNSN